jgi:hypothetical protein
MLDQKKIDQIAHEVATANLTPQVVVRASSSPTSDSEGRDALRIMIVIEPDAVTRVSGDAVVDTLVQLHDRLRREGEERFPIVEYATEEELQGSGDS